MQNLSEFKPLPYIFPRAIAEVELVMARPEDLKVYDPVLKMEVLKLNLFYWLKSSITGKIEPKRRKITPDTNPNDLKDWMDCGMIWIANEPFN